MTIASGFHGGWKDDLPDSLLGPLKPAAVRSTDDDTPHADHKRDDNRADSLGAIFVYQVEYPWSDLESCAYGQPQVALYPDMEDQDTWTCYIDSVLGVVDRVAGEGGLRDRFPNLEIHYDIWNEPDHKGMFLGSDTLIAGQDTTFVSADTSFYQTWKATVDTIRTLDAEAIITGPSFSGLNLYGPNEHPPSAARRTGPFMTEFLAYCKDNDCLPDILTWHSFGREWRRSQRKQHVRRHCQCKTGPRLSQRHDNPGVCNQ